MKDPDGNSMMFYRTLLRTNKTPHQGNRKDAGVPGEPSARVMRILSKLTSLEQLSRFH